MYKNNVPDSIKIIFNNINLYNLQYISILSILSLRKRKKITLEELFFYNVLGSLDDIELENLENSSNSFQYRYFQLEEGLSSSIITLINLGLIAIENKKEISNKYNLEVSLTDKGKKISSKLETNYFLHLEKKIMFIKKNYGFRKKLFRKLKGEK